jgi:AmmeMemoRadiSam system protein A
VVKTAGLLDPAQGRILLELARKTLENRLLGGQLPQEPDNPVFRRKAATFVTLKISGTLRGCIGNLVPVVTLWEGIHDNALKAAFHDHRFPPLGATELQRVHIDISILSPPQPLEYTDGASLLTKLRPGIDGVILRDGWRSATFLPQVWQQLPSPDQFLDTLCLKAGLPKQNWREKKLEIETYQSQCFAEEKL